MTVWGTAESVGKMTTATYFLSATTETTYTHLRSDIFSSPVRCITWLTSASSLAITACQSWLVRGQRKQVNAKGASSVFDSAWR